ncbi:uncharacterized protein LOC131942244 [Physella acuta]|uniref:uncharacterized protein LOC131942244 n=1 Tax=Physella acuta TaxID=109671 RepID=UPI0027DDE06E|nr:uncharacterized protein LOC131942244 [Physella acuta]
MMAANDGLVVGKKISPIEEQPLLLLDFTYVNIIHYCDFLNDVHFCNNNYRKALCKGQELFKDKFVSGLKFKENDDCFDIFCTVKAEMAKKKFYEVSTVIEKNGKISDGECECPGGKKPACCKHLFALLAAVEDYCRKELFSAPTEKLQVWHQPKPVQVSPQLTVSSFTTGTKQKSHFEPANLNINFKACDLLPPNLGIFQALNLHENIDFLDKFMYPKTIQLPYVENDVCSNNDFSNVSLTLSQILFYHMHVHQNLNSIHKLEYNTMSQNCDLWHSARKIRITALKAHNIIHRQNNFKDLAVKFITDSKVNLDHVLPIRLGKQREPMVKNLIKNTFKQYYFRNTGFIIHPVHNFIGASPDGLLYHTTEIMLVEIKCIFNPQRYSLEELCSKRKHFFLTNDSGNIHLNKTHSYYTQIQFQMFCANIHSCQFVVFYDFKKSLFFEKIEYDKEFCESNLKLLSHFYFNFYLPELDNIENLA